MLQTKPRLSQAAETFFSVLETGNMTETQYRAFKKRLCHQIEAASRLAASIEHTDERMADAREVLGIEISQSPKLKLVKG